jgi:hypothetical protein
MHVKVRPRRLLLAVSCMLGIKLPNVEIRLAE